MRFYPPIGWILGLTVWVLGIDTGLAQKFYFGADQSYVNEMEDCGAVYKVDGMPRDVYDIFEEYGCNLVRLRLWHTPAWYDDLNTGKRYSDLADVMKSIRRAREHQMEVLLDFHLSDNWADPSKQLVPSAWLEVVNDVDLLQDSLYDYIYRTLTILAGEDLLPEIVQIGNETNKGILLSPEDNQTYTLDWSRNAALFNRAIQAVRDVSSGTDQPVEIAIHVAGPADNEWFIDQFVSNGVNDFDWIAMSYYWAWHKPTTIAETGQVIRRLREKYPQKKVMIVETGYLWTTDNADAAPNIINEQHPDYLPASPENQKRWLIDLTTEVIARGGAGVVYWEPAWVSTPCFNQWNQGSHQDHATFFDFDHNVLIPGGIQWMEHEYGLTTSSDQSSIPDIRLVQSHTSILMEIPPSVSLDNLTYTLVDTSGRLMDEGSIDARVYEKNYFEMTPGVYLLSIRSRSKILITRKMIF